MYRRPFRPLTFCSDPIKVVQGRTQTSKAHFWGSHDRFSRFVIFNQAFGLHYIHFLSRIYCCYLDRRSMLCYELKSSQLVDFQDFYRFNVSIIPFLESNILEIIEFWKRSCKRQNYLMLSSWFCIRCCIWYLYSQIKMHELDNMLRWDIIAEMSDFKMIFYIQSFRIHSLLKFSWKVPKDKFQDQTTKLIYFDNWNWTELRWNLLIVHPL